MSNFAPSARTLALRDYLKTKSPDQIISYEEIAQETGITMDKTGRGYLRSALKAENIEYTPLVGQGIVLAGPETGCKIIETRIHTAKRAIQRSSKSHSTISQQYLSKMTQEDAKKVLYIGACFAAMAAASETLKEIQPTKAPEYIKPKLVLQN